MTAVITRSMLFCPFSGNPLKFPVNASEIVQFRKTSVTNGMIWHYDPFTGEQRSAVDVASDPFGSLLSGTVDSLGRLPVQRTPWKPYLKNRGDGVDGHYCVARYNPDKNCHEFWLAGKGWRSAGTVYRFDDNAIKQRVGDVAFWRNDAIESAAAIAERYGQSDVANDIRKLIG